MNEKFKKYSKILNHYQEEANEIYNLKNVIVYEKIDGTNFSFGLINNVPVINSKSQTLWINKRKKSKDGFNIAETFISKFGFEKFDELKSLGFSNILIYGEFFGPGIHPRIDYGKERRFVFYDAYNLETESWFPWVLFHFNICPNLFLDTPPMFYLGPPNKKKFLEILKSPPSTSLNKDNIIEGIVIKGLENEKNKFNRRIIIKIKSEKFSEKIKKPKKLEKIEISEDLKYVYNLAEQYVNESRLANCLEKFKAKGKEFNISLTGQIVKYIQQDILEELNEEEKNDSNFTEKHFLKHVGFLTKKIYWEFLNQNDQDCNNK